MHDLLLQGSDARWHVDQVLDSLNSASSLKDHAVVNHGKIDFPYRYLLLLGRGTDTDSGLLIRIHAGLAFANFTSRPA